MLTNDDLRSVQGITVQDAELREHNGRQELRLRLSNGNMLAISADAGGGLDMADVTSVP